MTVNTLQTNDAPLERSSDSERLIKDYGGLFIGGIMLLTAVGVGFGLLQAKQISTRLVQQATGQAELLFNGLSEQLDIAQRHVDGMRFVMENVLAHPELADFGAISSTLNRIGQGSPEGAPWDSVPKDLRGRTGTLFTRNAEAARSPELERMLSVLPLMWNAHQQHPDFQWSYYYDDKEEFSLLFPGLDYSVLADATGKTNMNDVLDVVYAAGGTYPVDLVSPGKNPERDHIWTPPYPDAAAAGLMISLVAPVYDGNSFVGAFGADLTLSVLNDLLALDGSGVGKIWVVARDGQVIATSEATGDMGQRIPQFSEFIPQLPIETVYATTPGDRQTTHDGIWKTFDLKGTPWKMLLYIPDADLNGAVFDVMKPYLAMTSLCVLSLIGLVLLQHRRFTLPALLLARHVETLPQNARIDTPQVPSHWRGLFGRANTTEKERREAIAKLQDLNADLESLVAERTHELTEANGQLSHTIDELKATQGQLVKAEKLASLGSLVAGIAHELNTPIGNAVMVASTLADRNKAFREAMDQPLRKSDLDEFVDLMDNGSAVVLRNLARAEELVTSFKQIAVDQTSYNRRTFQISEVLREINIALGPSLEKANAVIETRVEGDVEMDSYPGPVGQVLLNLYNNAIIHGFEAKGSGNIKVHAVQIGTTVKITVSDDGAGIPEENLNKIFDPFFTTRLGKGGSGLGLHILFNLVTDLLGGDISVESQVGKGTKFVITLPVVSPQRAKSKDSDAETRPPESGVRVH
ncbi:hypothetical protein GCM10011316_15100 [Roseibium aquae]|uniref:histidine kinase n=1 Tax=Roseibium aquae TaxID=1323746 RepID=A0A916THI5_9HYPH|nr:ATP-binding protein [Roseibium aquae]GGB44091.1 hypothetical protein GCM10011316_15100 [Roseibium aquae]